MNNLYIRFLVSEKKMTFICMSRMALSRENDVIIERWLDNTTSIDQRRCSTVYECNAIECGPSSDRPTQG